MMSCPKWIETFLKRAFSQKYLIVTNTVSCSSLLGAGDFLQQKIGWSTKSGTEGYDWKRTARVAALGLVLGPMNHHWYRLLDGRIGGRTGKDIATKVAADFAVSPIFACTFITGVAVLEGKGPSTALMEYRNKFFKILTLDVCVWPPTQVFNFWLVPPQGRVIYISTVQLLYNVFMSYIKHT
uniref:Mpv17-like protein 2 n=1 Tax=Plectus sambesii TaxID=2011161 RepID=A0A914W6U1_9BILA